MILRFRISSYIIPILLSVTDLVFGDAAITVLPFSQNHEYVSGSTLTLSCKATDLDTPTRWVINDYTKSVRCSVQEIEVSATLKCNETLGWFNWTFEKITPENKGIYECVNGRMQSITIDVLVPLPRNQKVEMKVTKPREYHNTTESVEPYIDLRPETSDDEQLTIKCTSGCAYPAPTLKWYSVIEGPVGEQLQIDSSMYHDEHEDCSDGLKRITSRLTLKAEEKLASSAKQRITCEARQDLTHIPDGNDIFNTGYLQVLYGDNARMGGLQAQPLSTLEIAGIAVGAGVILLLVLLGVACFMWSRSREQTQCEDPELKEKMNTNDEPV